MWLRLIVVPLLLLALAARPASSQESDPPGRVRQVLRRVAPIYPDLARRSQISGIVRLRATVAANGSVKSVEPLGGNPVLIKPAQTAVADWKYAPAPAETRELVELRFNLPH